MIQIIDLAETADSSDNRINGHTGSTTHADLKVETAVDQQRVCSDRVSPKL